MRLHTSNVTYDTKSGTPFLVSLQIHYTFVSNCTAHSPGMPNFVSYATGLGNAAGGPYSDLDNQTACVASDRLRSSSLKHRIEMMVPNLSTLRLEETVRVVNLSYEGG